MTWAVLDFETTSLAEPHPVEVALVRSDGVVLFHSLVRPPVPIGDQARAVHGSRDDELIDAPTWPEVHDRLAAALGEVDIVVAYRIDFEQRVLRLAADHHGLPWLGKGLRWYDAHHPPREGEHWSQDAARAELGLPRVPHRAVGDCRATIELMEARGDAAKLEWLLHGV